MNEWLLSSKQDSRFTAMVKEEYGGTVVLKEFLESGRIRGRKITRPALHAARPLPGKRKRLENLVSRQRKRDRYYENMVKKLGMGRGCPQAVSLGAISCGQEDAGVLVKGIVTGLQHFRGRPSSPFVFTGC